MALTSGFWWENECRFLDVIVESNVEIDLGVEGRLGLRVDLKCRADGEDPGRIESSKFAIDPMKTTHPGKSKPGIPISKMLRNPESSVPCRYNERGERLKRTRATHSDIGHQIH